MFQDLKNIFKIACIYMATIIGAGFASGQEISQFFSHYYRGGFYGILLSGILFALIGYVVMDKVYRERIKDFDELLFPAVGWLVGWIVELAVTLFMLSVFCIMIAGAGNVVMDKTGIPYLVGIALVIVLIMLVLLSDMRGILLISSFVTPILIIGMLVVGLYVIVSNNVPVFSLGGAFTKLTQNWFFSALLYVGYNSIIAIVVMCGMLPYLKKRNIGKLGGVLGGLMLSFIACIINVVIYLLHPESLLKELPVLSVVQGYNEYMSGFYALILWLAMFISAITSGYCFVSRIRSKVRVDRKLVTVALCLLVAPFSTLGFSNLISKLYPLFGYVGLFMVIVLLVQNLPFYMPAKEKRGRKE